MPPKSRRIKQLLNAREAKKFKSSSSPAASSAPQFHTSAAPLNATSTTWSFAPTVFLVASLSQSSTSQEKTSILNLDTSEYHSSEEDSYAPSEEQIDVDTAVHSDAVYWVSTLEKDDILICHCYCTTLLVGHLHLNITDSAKLIGETLQRSERTVRQWRAIFTEDNCNFPETQQGKYQCSNVLW